MTCILLSSFVETTNAICSITYGPLSENCERYTDSFIASSAGPGVNLTIALSQDANNQVGFCYTASVKYGVTTIKIVGTLIAGI